MSKKYMQDKNLKNKIIFLPLQKSTKGTGCQTEYFCIAPLVIKKHKTPFLYVLRLQCQQELKCDDIKTFITALLS